MIKNGRSLYSIVYGVDCGEAVHTAAIVLQEFVKKTAGVCLPIMQDGDCTDERKVISLGDTSYYQKEKSNFLLGALGEDGFCIRTVEQNVFIVANHDRGVLFGVYEFLERVFGVRFLAPDETYTPTLENVALEQWDIREKPAFPYRVYLAGPIMRNHQEFSSRMRMNNEWIRMPKKYGGRFPFADGGHNTLRFFVPPAEYAEEHPEWFYKDESKGKILDLCFSHVGILSNGEVDESLEISPVKICINKMFNRIISPEYAEFEYFHLAQEDTYHILQRCNCDDCLTQNEFFGRSGMIIRFVNAVNRGVKKKLQEAGIERKYYLVTFAYQWSEEAPWDYGNDCILHSTCIPDENVFVRVAPLNAKVYYALTDKSQIRSVRDMFNTWHKVTKNLMAWTYHVDYAGFLIYFPSIHKWGKDLRQLKQMNMQYVFMQAAEGEDNLWTDHINVYVASKMLWNPNRDPIALRREFISLYYNDVADYVNEFIKNFEEHYDSLLNDGVPLLERPSTRIGGALCDSKYYTKEFWEKQFAVLRSAIEQIEILNRTETEKQSLRKKIGLIWLTPAYMMGMHYEDYYPNDADGKRAHWDTFFEACERLGYKYYRENQDMTKLKKILFGENERS